MSFWPVILTSAMASLKSRVVVAFMISRHHLGAI
jgi:hypothetical protein